MKESIQVQQTQLWLLRHGECEGGDILRGQVDVPLTRRGLQQMEHALNANLVFDHIYSSPLQRCAEFAKSFCQQQVTELSLQPNLAELNFGDWDGAGFDTLYQQHGDALTQFWNDPWTNKHLPPQGEPMVDFEQRVIEFIKQCASEHVGEKVLLVTHGGVIRCLMAWALSVQRSAGFYSQLAIAYASVIQIDIFVDEQGQLHPKLYWPTIG
ncbi:phosphoglycerate mutase [Shewanella gelidii]|uniref:Phosphoglycerate mutase n=1 Tax=Shewanella gelidii TaxID=1642821 RepID=A0A917JMQ5_9GAMM|nr:phosphoglycerate mutase [Shewanella gelidii]